MDELRLLFFILSTGRKSERGSEKELPGWGQHAGGSAAARGQAGSVAVGAAGWLFFPKAISEAPTEPRCTTNGDAGERPAEDWGCCTFNFLFTPPSPCIKVSVLRAAPAGCCPRAPILVLCPKTTRTEQGCSAAGSPRLSSAAVPSGCRPRELRAGDLFVNLSIFSMMLRSVL